MACSTWPSPISYSDNVSILLGDGHGGFRTLPPIPLGDQASEPVSITAGDFTGDGVLDLAVANQGVRQRLHSPGRRPGDVPALAPDLAWRTRAEFPQAHRGGRLHGRRRCRPRRRERRLRRPDNVSITPGPGPGPVRSPAADPRWGRGSIPTSIITALPFGGGPLDLAIADPIPTTTSAFSVSLLAGGRSRRVPAPVRRSTWEARGHRSRSRRATSPGTARRDLAIGLQAPTASRSS